MESAVSDSLLTTVIIPVIIGVSLTILGWVLGLGSSYFFYQRSKRLKQPTWAIQGDHLIRGGAGLRLPKFDMRYDGSPVQNLTVSKIWLWNNGREPIRKEDIPPRDPLRIEPVGHTRLLDVEVLGTSHNWVSFSCVPLADHGNVQIQFEFLDQSQGGALQVVHTGTWFDDVQVKGTVVGGSPLKRVSVGLRDRNLLKRSWRFLILLVSGQVSITGIFLYYAEKSNLLEPLYFGGISLTVLFSVFLLLLFWIYFVFRAFNDGMVTLPHGLEAYL